MQWTPLPLQSTRSVQAGARCLEEVSKAWVPTSYLDGMSNGCCHRMLLTVGVVRRHAHLYVGANLIFASVNGG